MSREENRRENARRLATKCGGRAEFGRMLGMEASQVSQIIGKTPTKNIGNSIAKRIEAAFHLPAGYLDDAHPEIGASEDVDEVVVIPEPDLTVFPGATRVTIGQPRGEMFPVRHVKIRIQAGFPMFEQDPDFDEVDSIDMPRALIDQFQLIPHCLVAVKVKGDSMEPMMFDGESIVINTADVKPVTGGVYAVNFDHMPSVKQLVYEAGDWWMYSFNPAHKKVRCRSAEFSVIGKLVYQPGRSLIGKL